jgi:hypothetical protein
VNEIAQWQRAHIQAAAAYFRERMAQGVTDPKTKAVYAGLLEVLDPTRRATRLQREASEAAKVVPVQAARERRDTSTERRRAAERRSVDFGSPTGQERRAADRRSGRDRRDR